MRSLTIYPRKPALTAVLACLLVAAAACAESPPDERAEGEAEAAAIERFELPRGRYEAGAWIDDEIVLARSSMRGGHNVELWSTTPDGDRSEWLRLAQPKGCDSVDDLHPTMLPDGRLGFLRACRGGAEEGFQLMARTSETEVATLTTSPISAAEFSWSPDLAYVAVARSDELCAGIALLRDGKLHPFDVEIADEDGEFDLADEFTDSSAGCRDAGLADWPAWSSDRDVLGFFAAPASVGLEGLEKAESLWNLYTLDVGNDEVTKLIGGVRHPRGLVWSPDGQSLVFSGEVDGRGAGVWTYDLEDERLTRITDESAASFVLSPLGDRVAVLSEHDGLTQELMIFPVPGE